MFVKYFCRNPRLCCEFVNFFYSADLYKKLSCVRIFDKYDIKAYNFE